MAITAAELLEDFSLEMTGKDVAGLREAAADLPPGTRMNVTFLGNEDLAMRVTAARAVLDSGLVPVPHISARRIASQAMLEEFLSALQAEGASENVFSVGGDPHTPEGPYDGALDVIKTGLLQQYGVKHVSIAGYPEGHPDIKEDALWAALEGKFAVLSEQGLPGTILTQFSFDVDPVVDWIEGVRSRGVDLPIRIGVPGPAGIKRLITFASRFGVASSAGIAKKYGFSLTNLLGTAGPDRFISDLAARLTPEQHGVVRLHFYTFGGVPATAIWVRDYRKRLAAGH
ncbi:MAG: methylenetetrahydrofolate reductase [Naasia sp.]|jgi:methylenetetrahydrofolate reductase (NADPH)|uniref:methylenetetrahydrofolate reductase n=1 Tax=Naasia sp. TaxID=2546198 RepID=UPI00261A2B2C|nr:methylenetetrahydrofolate reductase [Naasia sp.]MCU1570122.1 methylenetetrahydrofolate reductase [Naasia sp.]